MGGRTWLNWCILGVLGRELRSWRYPPKKNLQNKELSSYIWVLKHIVDETIKHVCFV